MVFEYQESRESLSDPGQPLWGAMHAVELLLLDPRCAGVVQVALGWYKVDRQA